MKRNEVICLMRKFLIVLVSFAILILGISVLWVDNQLPEVQSLVQVSSAEVGSNILTLKEVLNNPSKYYNKIITIDCYYYEAHEKVVLASKVLAHKGGWRYIEDGNQVWVSWAVVPPKFLFEKLKKIKGKGVKPDLYGCVQVEGIFRAADNGGHLGEYKYEFEIHRLRIYDEDLKQFISDN